MASFGTNLVCADDRLFLTFITFGTPHISCYNKHVGLVLTEVVEQSESPSGACTAPNFVHEDYGRDAARAQPAFSFFEAASAAAQ
jgi:hypothetical protein